MIYSDLMRGFEAAIAAAVDEPAIFFMLDIPLRSRHRLRPVFSSSIGKGHNAIADFRLRLYGQSLRYRGRSRPSINVLHYGWFVLILTTETKPV
jgi:hypothetical protein